MNRILLINHDFPPTLAGVRRIVKMARYLPDSGFEPLILAASPAGHGTLDYDALDELDHQNCRVWRTPSFDLDQLQAVAAPILAPLCNFRGKFDLAVSDKPAPPRRVQSTRMRMLGSAATVTRRLLALPDDRFPWLATAIPAAEQIIRSQAIRYVLTSSYPNSTHLIGLYLKQRYNIHWHADFRDGWTQNPYFADYITPAHRRLNAYLERQVALHADTITAVSDPIANYLSQLSGRANVTTLPNGFDPTDLDDIPDLPTDKFRMAYTGTMFMQRSPDSFFAAVRGLLDSYPGLHDNIEIIFRSNFKPTHTEMIRDLNLYSVVQNWGMGTWKQALTLQKSADVLLVLEGENPNGHIMLTQKIFEYLATGKPILAIAPPGALADLVRATGAGIVIHPDNVYRIKETLFELFLGRQKLRRNEPLIQTYTRQRQAATLATILRNGTTSHG